MLRLKATKTSLYRLVRQYDSNVGGFRHCEFHKAFRRPDYFLKWHQEEGFARAVLAACMGKPLLSIDVYDIDGHQISHIVHHPALVDLRERGMVEEVPG